MKITAISSLQSAMGKVNMNVALEQNSANRNATQNAVVNPLSTKIELGPTAASHLLKSDSVDGYMLLPVSSSTSLLAQSPNLNLLSEPDAVAQEMSHNIRSSMSQSGDATLDITMPDHPIGESAATIDARKLADLPIALQDLHTQFGTSHSQNEFIEVRTEITESNRPYTVQPTKRNEPMNEMGMTYPLPDFVYTPNRTQTSLPNLPPNDIPYTEIPERVQELRPIAEKQSVQTIEKEMAKTRIMWEEQLGKPANQEGIHLASPTQPKENAVTFHSTDLEQQRFAEPLQKSEVERNAQNPQQTLDDLLLQFSASMN